MEKGRVPLPYGPQSTPLPAAPVHFLGILDVVKAPRKAPAKPRSPKAGKPLLSADRRVTFLDIEVRE